MGAEASLLTVSELRNRLEGTKTACLPVLVRYTPETVAQTAKLDLSRGKQPEDIADYINGAYYFYRACVNMFPGNMPHVPVKDAYEWPEPEGLSWDDMDKVTTLGRIALGRNDTASVTVPDKETVNELLFNGGIESWVGRPLNQVERYVLKMEKIIKFKIPNIRQVAFLHDLMEWQAKISKAYSLPLARISADVRNGKLPKNTATQLLEEHLDSLSSLQFSEAGVFIT